MEATSHFTVTYPLPECTHRQDQEKKKDRSMRSEVCYVAVAPIASAIFTTLLAILADAASIRRPSSAAAPFP